MFTLKNKYPPDNPVVFHSRADISPLFPAALLKGENADHRLLCSLATRKRVFVEVDCQLDNRFILLQLIPDVFGYFGFIFANRIHVIASTPKLSVSVFKFQVAPSLINDQ